jgi:hypothetical protein
VSIVFLCVQVGVSSEPSYDDYLWATSIFWSRGLALPVTYTQQQQQGGVSSSSSSDAGAVRIKVLEGLVPGLDFANHSQQVGHFKKTVAKGGGSPNPPGAQPQSPQEGRGLTKASKWWNLY